MADRDLDGIPDSIDSQPNVFNATKTNGGRPGGSGYSSEFAPDIPNITLPGYDRPVSAAEAKTWWKFADTRGGQAAAAKKRFLEAIASLGIPAKKASAVWADAVEWTQGVGSNTNRPDGYLSVLNPSMYTGGDGAAGPKYGATKTTDTRVTQYSPSSAAQTVSDTFEQELGRTASQAEINAARTGMNAAAKKEPSTYTGVTTTSAGGKGFIGENKSSGTQTTGFDPTMFARNFARSQPDFAESFAAKNFLGLIQKLLRDPNAIGDVVGDGN